MMYGSKRQASEASGKTIYTCPMHPEVQSAEAGKCPKCGMFLVAKTDAGSSEHKHEASGETGGCCGGSGHQHGHQHASGGGCCGGHKDEHAQP